MCSCRVLPHTCTTNSCGGIWSCIEKTDKQILYNQGTIAEVKKHVHYSQHVYRPCYLSWMWMLRSSTSYTEWVGLLLQYNLLLYRLAVYRGSGLLMAPNLLEWAHLYGLYFILSLLDFVVAWMEACMVRGGGDGGDGRSHYHRSSPPQPWICTTVFPHAIMPWSLV